MSVRTPIQWCDSTVNPVMGCVGCELWSKEGKVPERCYAAAQHKIRGGVSKGYAPWFGLPTLFPGRMTKAAAWSDLRDTRRHNKPWLDGMPRLIFTSDMSDALSTGEHLFANNLEPYKTPDGRRRYRPAEGSIRDGGVPFSFLETEIVDVAASENGSRHIWQWLTKLPARAAEFSSWLVRERGKRWPPNLWIGTSITSRDSLGRARKLLQVGDEQTIRFLSVALHAQWHDRLQRRWHESSGFRRSVPGDPL